MQIVFDASTAILLAKADLLRQVVIKGEAWMPATVVREVTAKQSHDSRAIQVLINEELIRSVRVKGGFLDLARDFRLHAGEAESVALAREKKAVCATDDGPAIRCCKVLGVPFVTAIGFLVALAEAQELEKGLALELVGTLERFGRYNVRILEDAARRIQATLVEGEKP